MDAEKVCWLAAWINRQRPIRPGQVLRCSGHFPAVTVRHRRFIQLPCLNLEILDLVGDCLPHGVTSRRLGVHSC